MKYFCIFHATFLYHLIKLLKVLILVNIYIYSKGVNCNDGKKIRETE